MMQCCPLMVTVQRFGTSLECNASRAMVWGGLAAIEPREQSKGLGGMEWLEAAMQDADLSQTGIRSNAEGSSKCRCLLQVLAIVHGLHGGLDYMDGHEDAIQYPYLSWDSCLDACHGILLQRIMELHEQVKALDWSQGFTSIVVLLIECLSIFAVESVELLLHVSIMTFGGWIVETLFKGQRKHALIQLRVHTVCRRTIFFVPHQKFQDNMLGSKSRHNFEKVLQI